MSTEIARRIPFARADITEAEIEEVVDTLRSGWLTTGAKTMRFAEAFREFVGCRHAVPVSSCTAALHLSLVALGIGPGDEVITTPYTFVSTITTILHVGARPVLVDIDDATFNLDAARVAGAVTPRTKAIIPVHFAGLPCDMTALRQIAAERGLRIVEDAAHAFPAVSAGRMVGACGDITAFSFYATKALTTGEGGMVTTERDDVAEAVRVLTLHGMSRDAWKRYTEAGKWWYDVVVPGYKYNMSDVQAAIGLHQLRRAEALWKRRASLARAYTERLRTVSFLRLPPGAPAGDEHAWHLYVVRVSPHYLRIDRAAFIAALEERGVSASVHFIPVHMHSFYRTAFGDRRGEFPVAERAYEEAISLPLFTRMSDDDVEYVVEQIADIGRRFS